MLDHIWVGLFEDWSKYVLGSGNAYFLSLLYFILNISIFICFVRGILFVLISVSVSKCISAQLTFSHHAKLRARSTFLPVISELDDRIIPVIVIVCRGQCFRQMRFPERFVFEQSCLFVIASALKPLELTSCNVLWSSAVVRWIIPRVRVRFPSFPKVTPYFASFIITN